MSVKVKCLVGDAPSELSHHPELRLRFPPRPGNGAPLIANGVSIQVRSSSGITNWGKSNFSRAPQPRPRRIAARGFVSSPTLRSSSRRRALTSTPARSLRRRAMTWRFS